MSYESRWRTFRGLFFVLLSIELFITKYGSRFYGGYFNVSHVRIIDDSIGFVSLSPVWIETTSIYMAMISLLCLSDTLFPVCCPMIAVIYTFNYLASRLDSYQHHFFNVLLLWNLSMLSMSNIKPRIQTLKYQVSILYFFTAITKMHAMFTSGVLLQRQLLFKSVYDSISFVSETLFIDETVVWSVMAYGVVAHELFLCYVWATGKKGWLFTITGISLHIAIELSGFKILMFSYYMIALYVFVVPKTFVKRFKGSINEKKSI